MSTLTDIVSATASEFVDGLVASLPTLLSGVLFLVIAFLVIWAVRYGLRSVLARTYPSDQSLIADFFVLVVTVFLWFAVGLIFLKVVGMGDLAASLGTAAGFIVLGISYALSEMLEDTVAGVYLLRDPDFNPGDTVSTSGMTGTVTDIGLRKSRFRLDDGNTVVMANRDVESRWTRQVDESSAA